MRKPCTGRPWVCKDLEQTTVCRYIPWAMCVCRDSRQVDEHAGTFDKAMAFAGGPCSTHTQGIKNIFHGYTVHRTLHTINRVIFLSLLLINTTTTSTATANRMRWRPRPGKRDTAEQQRCRANPVFPRRPTDINSAAAPAAKNSSSSVWNENKTLRQEQKDSTNLTPILPAINLHHSYQRRGAKNEDQKLSTFSASSTPPRRPSPSSPHMWVSDTTKSKIGFPSRNEASKVRERPHLPARLE